MAAAIPLATMAISAYMAHRSQKNAEKLSKTEQQAQAQQAAIQETQQQQGIDILNRGAALQQPAANYYRTLLTGNRGAMAQAVAPTRALLEEGYRGAERGLEHAGVQGAAKDVAEAELGRDRASKIAGLVTGVQPAAADAVANLGGQQVNAGAGLTGQAGGLATNMYGQGFNQRTYAREQGAQAGAAWGRMFADAAGQTDWSKIFARKQATLPSTPTTPNWTSWTPPQGGGF